MKKLIFFLAIIIVGLSLWFLYSEIYSTEAQYTDQVSFKIEEGETVIALANRLEEQQIIRHGWLFKKYLSWKGLDRQVRRGTFEVLSPITLARVVEALSNPSTNEREITVIPGWDLRDIAEYFQKEEIMGETNFDAFMPPVAVNLSLTRQLPQDMFVDIYEPPFQVLQDKPWSVSFEGYFAPDTYRVYKDASVKNILLKLIKERDSQFSEQMYADIKAQGRSIHSVLIIASILEREVRTSRDRRFVSDIFWRRYDRNWALQADSTVHYAVGKKGSIATTAEDRDSLSPWNTYKYHGLPPGPISNPSLDSIMAAIYPEENDYWYFLTTFDTGEVKYAETLEDHNKNVWKYLR